MTKQKLVSSLDNPSMGMESPGGGKIYQILINSTSTAAIQPFLVICFLIALYAIIESITGKGYLAFFILVFFCIVTIIYVVYYHKKYPESTYDLTYLLKLKELENMGQNGKPLKNIEDAEIVKQTVGKGIDSLKQSNISRTIDQLQVENKS